MDDPNWAPIIGLNAAYTYSPTYAEVLHAYNQSSTMPAFMIEANYEYETNTGTDGGSTRNLRMQEYWTMLSGATGQLYGNHYTVRFPSGWQNYLDSPGVVQLGYMANLFGSRAWYNLVPDQTHAFVTGGYGSFVIERPLYRQQLCDVGGDARRLARHGLSAARRDDHRRHDQPPEHHHRPLV